MHTNTQQDRFWRKVIKGTPQQCWEWNAGKFWCGYGSAWFNGKVWYAHRLAYYLEVGEIPSGGCVCHSCDNRGCVNPNHLFLGTNSDNVTDKVSKSRQAKGEKHGDTIRPKTPRGISHPRVKLTLQDVKNIRRLYVYKSKELGSKGLAEKFGVRFQTILAIVKRKNWTHI